MNELMKGWMKGWKYEWKNEWMNTWEQGQVEYPVSPDTEEYVPL